MTRHLAGHTMAAGPAGDACSICGRTWIDMLNNRDRWRPGQLGIAHRDALNAAECQELHAEIERIFGLVCADSAR